MAFMCLCGSDKLLNDEKSWIRTKLESIARPIKKSHCLWSTCSEFVKYNHFIVFGLACSSLFWQMVCTRSKFLKMEMVIETGCDPLVNASLRCCNWWKACATSASDFRRTFQGCGKKIYYFPVLLITTIIFH